MADRWAVFLDRDGVLNALVPDPETGLPESPVHSRDVELLPGAVDGLQTLRELGVPLVVISNQPSAAKGKSTLEDLRGVHEAVHAELEAAGVGLDSYEYCFHHPDGIGELGRRCDCRKPQPGMILRAAAALGCDDLQRSWMIGDSEVDVKAGLRAGCRTILVEHTQSSHRRSADAHPDERVATLADAADIITSRLEEGR